MDDKDTIYRQEAIDALLELVEARRTWINTENARKEISGIDASMCAIHDLPSAQPERKKGKWVYNSPVTMKCDQCGIVIKDWDWHRFIFCPHCGAHMKGKQKC